MSGAVIMVLYLVSLLQEILATHNAKINKFLNVHVYINYLWLKETKTLLNIFVIETDIN